jgi:hypothetical protein
MSTLTKAVARMLEVPSQIKATRTTAITPSAHTRLGPIPSVNPAGPMTSVPVAYRSTSNVLVPQAQTPNGIPAKTRTANAPAFRFPSSPQLAVQARMAGPALSNSKPSRHGIIQRAASAVAENKSLKSAQSTYLVGSAFWSDESSTEYQATSGPRGHAEEIFLAEFAAHRAAKAPLTVVHLFISLNRSPCSSTPGIGTASSSKAAGAQGCAEKLLALKATLGPGVHMAVDVRDIYGSNSDKEANSLAALHAMQVAGIPVDTQQRGGTRSDQFPHTSAAIALSKIMK